jgi:hypothetical protein
MITYRKSNGSMTFLIVLTIGLLLIVALCGVGFNQLLLKRSQGQYLADANTLSLATNLNKNDRIGELNEIEEASRELVFLSRQDCDKSSTDETKSMARMCDQLLDEARTGQALVESERKNQVAQINAEVLDAVALYNRKRNQQNNFAFLGLKTYDPEILRVDLGAIKGVNSNVKGLDAIPDLWALDSFKSYVDPKTKLYKSNIPVKLPYPDTDLEFKFASLPACVGKTIAPARNTNSNVFVPYGTIYDNGKIKTTAITQVPSAIQVQYDMNVNLPWERTTSIEKIGITSSGSASGASAESK